ncbi:TIMELESS-interacting protein [Augochlora pura]
MPNLSNTSDYDDEDDIVAEYERHDLDAEQNTEERDIGSDNEENQDQNNVPRRVDPSSSKKPSVRNPIPTLNADRLKGPKGLQTIEKYFEGFKFYGKGHEKSDLDRILKRMEHWSHRLFPKLEFDTFLERVEKLGTKRDLQVFIKKYRMGMINTDDVALNVDEGDDDNEKEEDEPIDEFDLLIAEQIEKQKQVNVQSANKSTADDLFDKLMSQSNNNSQASQPVKENTTPSQLSNEVKEQIERNRQQALQRRQARLKALEEDKREKLEGSSGTEFTNISNNAQILNDTQNMEVEDLRKVENEKES